VVDDFRADIGIEAIANACDSVGFNTIPAWLRPFAVLSNGEKFRVSLARSLLELDSPVVMDEFTSVVDRQVAKIGSHAVQKFVRARGGKFVAVSCHYDIIDWLQPDWIIEPAAMTFQRRLLQRRPAIECNISAVKYQAWHLFAQFHYLTKELHRSARCFCLFVNDIPAAFAGMLFRPHPRVRDIMGCSRLVTLPDYQGMGLAMALIDKIGAAYKATGKRVHTYPAHPALIRSFGRSQRWRMEQKPGKYDAGFSPRSTLPNTGLKWLTHRPCAVFEYIGDSLDRQAADLLLQPFTKATA
jgi:GNAT superfamily N-acetyltransferase